MTPDEIRTLCDAIPLTLAEIAAEIGISYGHLRNCRAGRQRLGRPAELLLIRLARDAVDG